LKEQSAPNRKESVRYMPYILLGVPQQEGMSSAKRYGYGTDARASCLRHTYDEVIFSLDGIFMPSKTAS
jgi:hypothetical protein